MAVSLIEGKEAIRLVASNELKEGDVLLEIEDIHMYFGKVAALAGVSLKVRKGEIHSVIGPNGAGKTVMMNCINGLYHPQKGDIYFKGQHINRIKPYERAKLGMSRTLPKLLESHQQKYISTLLIIGSGKSIYEH